MYVQGEKDKIVAFFFIGLTIAYVKIEVEGSNVTFIRKCRLIKFGRNIVVWSHMVKI